MHRRGVQRCLLAAVLFGASAPAASELAGDVSSLVLAGLLYVGAGLAVTPHVVANRPDRAAVVRDWKPAAVAVIAGGAIGPALLVAGLARTSAASDSILLNLELAATVALAATVFREHLGRRLLTGAALVTVAGVVLVWGPGASLDTGALFVAAACVAWGLDNSVTARIDQLSPEHVVFLKGFVAGTANLCLGLLFATSGPSVSVAEITAALVIGATGYGASIVLWVKGARDLGAARGQVIFATAPFIGALIAWIVLRETATGTQVLAVAIAAIGVGVSLKSAHAHEHDHDQIEHEHEHHHDDGHHDHHGGNEAMRDVSHTHRHLHRRVTHSHPHVPDLHHRHH